MTNEERPPMLGRRWRDEDGDVWECAAIPVTPCEAPFWFVRLSTPVKPNRIAHMAQPLDSWVEVTS